MSANTKNPTWRGVVLRNAGEVIEALAATRSPEEANRFMEMYRRITPKADENIRFFLSYSYPQYEKRLTAWLHSPRPSRKLSQQEFRMRRFKEFFASLTGRDWWMETI